MGERGLEESGDFPGNKGQKSSQWLDQTRVGGGGQPGRGRPPRGADNSPDRK